MLHVRRSKGQNILFDTCQFRKWIAGYPVMLGGNWENVAVIMVCVGFVKNVTGEM